MLPRRLRARDDALQIREHCGALRAANEVRFDGPLLVAAQLAVEIVRQLVGPFAVIRIHGLIHSNASATTSAHGATAASRCRW